MHRQLSPAVDRLQRGETGRVAFPCKRPLLVNVQELHAMLDAVVADVQTVKFTRCYAGVEGCAPNQAVQLGDLLARDNRPDGFRGTCDPTFFLKIRLLLQRTSDFGFELIGLGGKSAVACDVPLRPGELVDVAQDLRYVANG